MASVYFRSLDYFSRRTYEIVMTESLSDLEWKKSEKDVWIRYAWEDIPLEVVTISEVGSNQEISFEVAETAHKSFASVVVRMSDIPIGYVKWCHLDSPLKNFPEAPDNVRIWKFSKHGLEGITIECNQVVVADIKFAESQLGCSSSPWKASQVNFIKFNPDHDKTVAIGTRGNFCAHIHRSSC